MTIRLSISNFAGMARTLVAVGTSNDADMFFTTAAAAPRSTSVSSPSAGTIAGAAGLAGALAGAAAVVFAGVALGGGGGAGGGGGGGFRGGPRGAGGGPGARWPLA